MDVLAEIAGINYIPFLCRELNEYSLEKIASGLPKKASFILSITENSKIALSWWVSPKRTRSYPYARVYDTLSFQGKRVTVIPIMKDEGKDGDRDYLQWDTVSLMSLLGIYTIISYYCDAERSKRYQNKITNQKYDILHIKKEIQDLLAYQSDALHWNLLQIDKVAGIGQKSLDCYEIISSKTGVEMHSKESAENRIMELQQG